MIGFSCKNCGHTFGVQDQYSGQRIKCPRCDFVGLVVDNSGRIKITCQNCGNENSVPETLAGHQIKCPKCNNQVVIPPLEKESADRADKDLHEEISDKHEESEITEHKLIVIISAIAVVIVAGLITTAALIPLYKSRKALKSQDMQKRQQVDDTQQTEQNVQGSRENPLRLRNALKWQKNAAIVCVIAIPCFIVLFSWIYWCPECHKMWAMRRTSPFIHFGAFNEYVCKYCGHIKKIR